MYKRHKILLMILVLATFILSLILKIGYGSLCESAIAVVSIALAVYIAAASALLGSPYSKALKALVDEEDNTRSQLGVIAHYLRIAGWLSVITIVISCLYIVEPEYELPARIIANVQFQAFKRVLFLTFSAISNSLFVANIFFFCQIFRFLTNSLTKAAK